MIILNFVLLFSNKLLCCLDDLFDIFHLAAPTIVGQYLRLTPVAGSRHAEEISRGETGTDYDKARWSGWPVDGWTMINDVGRASSWQTWAEVCKERVQGPSNGALAVL